MGANTHFVRHIYTLLYIWYDLHLVAVFLYDADEVGSLHPHCSGVLVRMNAYHAINKSFVDEELHTAICIVQQS